MMTTEQRMHLLQIAIGIASQSRGYGIADVIDIYKSLTFLVTGNIQELNITDLIKD